MTEFCSKIGNCGFSVKESPSDFVLVKTTLMLLLMTEGGNYLSAAMCQLKHSRRFQTITNLSAKCANNQFPDNFLSSMGGG